MDRLKGEVAIVTGASRGIGRAVALCFARKGARVAITAVADRDALEQVQREIAAAGADVLATIADVARRADVDGLVQGIVAKWGRIDILVNNAGILRIAPLENISEERWDETLAVHLKGTFNCTQAVLPFMKQQRKGKIINLAAPSALRGSYGVADYAAAKGGIIAFTRNAANELKAYNIQVNCILPGYYETELTTALRNDPERYAYFQSRIPAGRWGQPSDLKGTVIFLASRASDYVTGVNLPVDGGYLAG